MFILAGNAILVIIIFSNIVNINNDISYNSRPTTPVINIKEVSNSPVPVVQESEISVTTDLVSTSTLATPIPTPITEVQGEKTEITTQTESTRNVGLSLMQKINNFRAGKGLSSLTTEGYTCAFASLRAGEIVGNFNHDGFRQRIDSSSLPYPSYTRVAENIALNPNPDAVIQSWIDSPGHNENMSKDVQHGCVGVNGQYFAFEAWTP